MGKANLGMWSRAKTALVRPFSIWRLLVAVAGGGVVGTSLREHLAAILPSPAPAPATFLVIITSLALGLIFACGEIIYSGYRLKPKLRILFNADTCFHRNVTTNALDQEMVSVSSDPHSGKTLTGAMVVQARLIKRSYPANYVGIEVENLRGADAEGCKVELRTVEFKSDRSESFSRLFHGDLQLSWAPAYEFGFVDRTISGDDSAVCDVFHVAEGKPVNLAIRNLPSGLDGKLIEPGIYRFTIRASGKDAGKASVRMNVRWSGDWDGLLTEDIWLDPK